MGILLFLLPVIVLVLLMRQQQRRLRQHQALVASIEVGDEVVTTSGIFGTPDAWVETVRRVANRAGDRAWPMPLFDEYKDQLKSDIADFTNVGGRPVLRTMRPT